VVNQFSLNWWTAICNGRGKFLYNGLPGTYGRRAFAIAGPTTWNSLPTHFRRVENSTAAFGRLLKTHLFSEY